MGSLFSSGISSNDSIDNNLENHGNVHLINDRSDWNAKLQDATSNGKVVVVDFTATWCGPCKFIGPFFSELSVKYPNLIFLKVDVDQHSDITQEYDVHAMPTFVFILNSNIIEKLVGANKGELERKVKQFSMEAAAA